MRKHYKNIQLYEEGFNAAYFEKRLEISTARARAWTDKRIKTELRYPVLYSKLTISLLTLTPLALMVVLLWRGL